MESTRSDRPVTYFEAALTVLRRAKRPLTAAEIVGAAIERGLVTPKGRTPEATMSAELYRRTKSDSGLLVKLETPGRGRAKRGSVRWTLSHSGRASG
jgi:hypothetical protein